MQIVERMYMSVTCLYTDLPSTFQQNILSYERTEISYLEPTSTAVHNSGIQKIHNITCITK